MNVNTVEVLIPLAHVGVAAMTIFTLLVVITGRQLAALDSITNRSGEIRNHVILVSTLDVIVVVSVVIIKSLVNLSGGPWITGPFYWVHMIFVAGFSILWILIHFMRGTKTYYHAHIAYTFVFVTVLLACSGEWMLLQHPSL